VTLTCLAFQSYPNLKIIVSDQTEEPAAFEASEVKAVERLLSLRGHETLFLEHLPRKGVAENRQFLLEQATSPLVLYMDDDLMLDGTLVERLVDAIEEEGCGFVGSAVIGLSYMEDVRPHEQEIELWEGPVRPETVLPESPAWDRYRLHNAANLQHAAERLRLGPGNSRKYRVAWIGGCVMYDRAKLEAVGGFSFWRQMPPHHAGEDVLAQLRVMARFGGCGLIPSGVYHQELPTTVPDRRFDAPRQLSIFEDEAPHADAID
jgi:hypothetical protein